jgi:hypothetical protein
MTGNYKPLRIERNSIKGFSTIELAFVMLCHCCHIENGNSASNALCI